MSKSVKADKERKVRKRRHTAKEKAMPPPKPAGKADKNPGRKNRRRRKLPSWLKPERFNRLLFLFSVFLVAAVLLWGASPFIVKESSLVYHKVFAQSPGKKQAAAPPKPRVRMPAVEGMFYPSGRENIESMISIMMAHAPSSEINGLTALIVPHAGYRYSGVTASYGFKAIPRYKKRIVILAPSHYANFRGVSWPDVDYYRTALGDIPLDSSLTRLKAELESRGLFIDIPEAHQHEHSIEVELPFLQSRLENFSIVPLLFGPSTTLADTKEIADILHRLYNGKDVLFLVSSDFTHYGPNYNYIPFRTNVSANIRKFDFWAFKGIKAVSPADFFNFIITTHDTVCGRIPILTLLFLLKNYYNVSVRLLNYSTSGGLTGDYTNSVSYFAIALVSNSRNSGGEGSFLLELANKTLYDYVRNHESYSLDPSVVDGLDPDLREKRGCFVTLKEEGRLRGCIGHIIPREPLYKCVIDNAINAASRDVRFRPVSADELSRISLEVSVLSVPELLNYTTTDDLKEKLVPMRDGVVLAMGNREATYLPQVWEQLPTKESFLSSLCLKAGLDRDCWTRHPSIYVYHADVFS